MNWSEWKSFRKEALSQIPEKAGIYQLRSLRDDGNPQSISRLLGKDQEGIVYIGESSNLKKRIQGFWSTITKRDRSRHAAGWSYVTFDFQKTFPPESLQFRYSPSEDFLAVEFDLLLFYLKEFGDRPPLNTNRGIYPDDWEEKIEKVFGHKPLYA